VARAPTAAPQRGCESSPVISTKRLLFNAATFIPGVTQLPPVQRVFKRHSIGTHGTIEARYCYSVWLRHLMCAAANGLDTNPKAVAELGPGDSIGIGIASVLTGVERYFAFDVVAHANTPRNLAIFDGLVELFRRHENIPDATEYPRVGPSLRDYRYPGHILTPDRMRAALDPARLARVRADIARTDSKDSTIQYRAPWSTKAAVERETLDLVFSQATLEHVDGLPEVYRAMYDWLKPGAYMSHQIDFKCHNSAREWNGHWTYSKLMWKLVRGKDVWLINRLPYSEHVELMQKAGFRIVSEQFVRRASNIRRSQLASQFRDIPDRDLTTTDAFVQAVKWGHS
jgi:methyltransferase family protein